MGKNFFGLIIDAVNIQKYCSETEISAMDMESLKHIHSLTNRNPGKSIDEIFDASYMSKSKKKGLDLITNNMKTTNLASMDTIAYSFCQLVQSPTYRHEMYNKYMNEIYPLLK